MGHLRPRERLLRSAIAAEARLRYKGRRMHKRFRSWSQHRVRQYWLPQKVSLHADTAAMSPAYLAAAVQKAATLRKHDASLWFNFSRRAQQVADSCTPQQLGYLFYGFGKARFLDPPLYMCLLRYAVASLEDFSSHALMTIPWALSRVAIRDADSLTQSAGMLAFSFMFFSIDKTSIGDVVSLQGVAQETVLKAPQMRAGDLIKIAVGLAKLGVCPPSIKERISDVLLPALKEASSLEFRSCMHPLAVLGVYTQPLQTFVMERFSKIFICARPPHLEKALQTAVAIRVLQPETWAAVPRKLGLLLDGYRRGRGSQANDIRRWPSSLLHQLNPIHRSSQVSAQVTAAAAAAEAADAAAEAAAAEAAAADAEAAAADAEAADAEAAAADAEAAAAVEDHRLMRRLQLFRLVLSDLGWEVRRVVWFEWVGLQSKQERIDFLSKLRAAPALPSFLPDPLPALSPQEVQQRLQQVKQRQQQQQQEAAAAAAAAARESAVELEL
ncbi:uncharacterized protein EMH_0021520 [Eimeria mitis]|uniref:RAP domain-containing protein n=1 Tax=Eimeria mitis TaxID=44415 RepID=U6KF07_9EIME|nr:uncharacterized protein EMH_0021520 [Eimeria mitis]CDJ36620.1 hypothetical protein, conserved [Eimeria mitis]